MMMLINGEFKNETEIRAYIKKLEAEVKELREKETAHFVECGEIANYDDELSKAKELLKAAVKDITNVRCNNDTYAPGSCDMCVYNNNCDYSDSFKWKHADEALALIGKDTNVPTTVTVINVGGKKGGEQNDNDA